MNERGAPARHFLGWDRPPLESAAEWLAERDTSELFVVLPGSRAARRLEDRLARLVGPTRVPPRVLTTGDLIDELVPLRAPRASRLARTIAWARALRELPANERARLVPQAPSPDELFAWLPLAEALRRLFAELAAEGRDFASVAPEVEPSASARWRALAATQARYEAAIASAGLADPHLGRLRAIEAGEVVRERSVVLAGASDLNGMLRRALAMLGERVAALVFAPPCEAAAFDELGCLRPAVWSERAPDLPLERWKVVDGPADQAAAVARALSDWNGRFAAEEITIGVADPEVVPYVRRRLRDAGLAARDAAGTPWAQSAPARLLSAAARYLASRGAAEHAELLRQPDLARALAGEADPAASLDVYRAWHLPARADGPWLTSAERSDVRAAGAELERTQRSLHALFGELASEGARPLASWGEPTRAFLSRVYAGRPADRRARDEGERALGESLHALGGALEELEDLPHELAPPAHAAQALAQIGAMLRAASLPPAPARTGEPTLDLLGWLELALDDAPALIATGFNDERVPESVHGDPFLPDPLRRRLGVVDNERRLARDAYAAALMLHSRAEVCFVTARHSAARDPLRPSRLAFGGGEREIVRRVRHFLPPEGAAARPAATRIAAPAHRLARLGELRAPAAYSVTSFRRYLESPYLFYLVDALGLESVEDRAREMDALAFGVFAHEVLRVFGESDARDSTSEQEIAAVLEGELARRALERFGRAPLPAVSLQLEQLAWRLRHFAREQAQRARDGWRIAHVEWQPAAGPKELDVDGEPVLVRGRIDRIDRHESDGYAILDYKTGEQTRKPRTEHRARDGTWRDLQLPLYCWLTAELEMDELPRLGYVTLGRDPAAIGFAEIEGWTEEDVAAGLEAARDVVRAVRRGALFEVGRADPHEPVLRALVGKGLFAAGPEDEEADAADDPDEERDG